MAIDLDKIARSGVEHRLTAIREEMTELRQWLKATKKKKYFAGVNIEEGKKPVGRPRKDAAADNGQVRAAVAAKLTAPFKKKRTMSAKARKAISMAQKKRWAAQKAAGK